MMFVIEAEVRGKAGWVKVNGGLEGVYHLVNSPAEATVYEEEEEANRFASAIGATCRDVTVVKLMGDK